VGQREKSEREGKRRGKKKGTKKQPKKFFSRPSKRLGVFNSAPSPDQACEESQS
jgi:hypothetical protein